jgi:hypothetical protein
MQNHYQICLPLERLFNLIYNIPLMSSFHHPYIQNNKLPQVQYITQLCSDLVNTSFPLCLHPQFWPYMQLTIQARYKHSKVQIKI